MWSRLSHSNITLPVAMSISCTTPDSATPGAGARIARRGQDEVLRARAAAARAVVVRDGQGGRVRSGRVTKCSTPRASAGVAGAVGMLGAAD
jgi:hypothetical protein